MKIKINWGTALVLFFVIFFAWVIFFVQFAMRQNNDLVSEDYYQQGAGFSNQIEINRRSAPYQDSMKVAWTGGQGKISIGRTVAASADSLQVYFFRSSDKKLDFSIPFPKPDTLLLTGQNKLSHGRYQVFINWQSHGEKFMVRKFLDVE